LKLDDLVDGCLDHHDAERYDAGQIDAFELDELIHHYTRATQTPWSFCTGGGAVLDRADARVATRTGRAPRLAGAGNPTPRTTLTCSNGCVQRRPALSRIAISVGRRR
jgi:hypothetical protein